MGYIKEPDGVDFYIKSRKLTPKENLELSEYIKAEQAKYRQQKADRKYAFA